MKLRHKLKNAIAPRTEIFGAAALAFALLASGCATVKSVFGTNIEAEEAAPIENPFQSGSVSENSQSDGISSPYETERGSRNMVLRTRRGNRAIEVELPNSGDAPSELSIPVSPMLPPDSDTYAGGGMDSEMGDRRPSASDREITASLPEAPTDVTAQRQNIEEQLHLVPTQDKPHNDRSYLAAMDKIKILYRRGRFEAALLETDELLRDYPTDPRVYEMRGTLFDRIRRPELALKNWKQALRLDPQNESLRRFIDKKEQTRGLASP